MSDLERFAAAILAQWRGEGASDTAPLAVSDLLDRVLPYRVARRLLGVDSSEDYESMMLRLLAEEGGLAAVMPRDAAEFARATVASKLPDLGVLQLLRAASFTLTERVIGAAAQVASPTKPVQASQLAPDEASVAEPPPSFPAPVIPEAEAAAEPRGYACWACLELLPTGANVKFCPFCGADQRQPTCAACGAAAQIGWKHCAECGAKL